MKEILKDKLLIVGKFIKKYRYILSIITFLIAITLFNDFNIFTLSKKYKTLVSLKEQEKYLKSKLNTDSTRYMELKKDDVSLEKFAREQYYFHKSNEDVFIIEKIN